jgi:uncharacterized protein YecE (DUF72 family)
MHLIEKPSNVLLGTSGWSYKEWIGPFYSKEDKSMLRAYAKVFETVEIDSTFYRYPSKGMVMGWAKYTPEGFIYTAKLPQLITHEKKLDLSQGVEEDLGKFIELLEPLWLSGKLGCILIQLPPKLDYRLSEMEDFFKILPTNVKFAIEFRNNSWMRQETWSLLEKYRVAYAIVDEPLLPPEVHVTSNVAYFRWHGRGTRPWFDYRYRPDELSPWVPQVQETVGKVEKVFGYFNNHYHGYAVENCLQVLQMLGHQTPQQALAKDKIDNYFKSLGKTREFKLEAFAEPRTMSFEELLRYFVAAGRLERAQSIEDSELSIVEQTDERVEATVREYHIVIDLENKTIYHDCADWGKILSTKKLCKHIGKLLLSMDREKALSTLRQIYTEKDTWQFKPYTV